MAQGGIRRETLETLEGNGRVYYNGKSVEAHYQLKVTQDVGTQPGEGTNRGLKEGRGILVFDNLAAAHSLPAVGVELELEDGRRWPIIRFPEARGAAHRMVRFVLSGAPETPPTER